MARLLLLARSMSYRVAVATTDNQTIASHFGKSARFAIFAILDDFNYRLDELRSVNEQPAESGSPADCSCACSSKPQAAEVSPAGSVGYALEAGGCGSGGCGSGGCGGSSSEPVDPRLQGVIEGLSDVQLVIAGTLGPGAQAALAQRGIRAFAVTGPISKALDKLVSYERRQHERERERTQARTRA